MRLVLDLARLAMDHGGGPFAAGVFDQSNGRLIAPGVNVVVPARCSAGHAEVMAITVAQQVLGHFDLSAEGLPPSELVTSTEPCTQCFGVVALSGLRGIVCGARSEDAEAIGFDEGPKPRDWPSELAARGIDTVRGVLRDEATAILAEYERRALPVYHPRR
jgi:tRNA(Arg) A34 adenosine deaminase TadA